MDYTSKVYLRIILPQKATIDVPINVAVQYNRKFVITPDNATNSESQIWDCSMHYICAKEEKNG